MNYWLPKKKTLVFSLVVVVASLAVYLASLYFVNAKITEIEKAYSEAESIIAEDENSRAIIHIADENASEIQALRDFFVAPGDEVGFIEEIEAVAKSSGLSFEITSINQDKVSTDPVKEDIKVRIGVEGSWQSVLIFIRELEIMPFIAVITNTSLDAKGENVWSGFIELVVFREKMK